jgi:hypothetical protein
MSLDLWTAAAIGRRDGLGSSERWRWARRAGPANAVAGGDQLGMKLPPFSILSRR